MERKKIFLVSLAHLSCDVNGGALPAALPYIRAAHGLDYQATGGLMLAYSCLSSVIQPLFGFLADKHKKPWFIPVGIILAGCGVGALGFMGNYWAMFLAIALSGIGSAFFHPEAARFANRVSGQSKGAGLSLFSIGGNGGFILGPLLVTAFVGLCGLSGMGIFALIALVMAGVMCWQIGGMKSIAPPSPKKDIEAAEFSAADAQAAEGDQIAAKSPAPKEAVNNWREFGKLTLVIVSRAITFTGCNTFIPLYWVSAFNQPKAAGAFALVIFGVCGVACNLLGGFLSDRVGYVRVIRAAFAMMPFAVLFFGLSPNIYVAYGLLPCLGLVLYMPFSSQVVLGQQLLAKNIGFASGVTLGLATTLGGIAQPLLGWVADTFSLHAVFYCLAAISCVGCLFSLLLSREKANV